MWNFRCFHENIISHSVNFSHIKPTNVEHNIKNLKNSKRKVVEYCPELVAEMLDIESYFNALCDGLGRSNGVYLDKRAKN